MKEDTKCPKCGYLVVLNSCGCEAVGGDRKEPVADWREELAEYVWWNDLTFGLQRSLMAFIGIEKERSYAKGYAAGRHETEEEFGIKATEEPVADWEEDFYFQFCHTEDGELVWSARSQAKEAIGYIRSLLLSERNRMVKAIQAKYGECDGIVDLIRSM